MNLPHLIEAAEFLACFALLYVALLPLVAMDERRRSRLTVRQQAEEDKDRADMLVW